jgi:hypothetical protein
MLAQWDVFLKVKRDLKLIARLAYLAELARVYAQLEHLF